MKYFAEQINKKKKKKHVKKERYLVTMINFCVGLWEAGSRRPGVGWVAAR